jgi:hypothetical protein
MWLTPTHMRCTGTVHASHPTLQGSKRWQTLQRAPTRCMCMVTGIGRAFNKTHHELKIPRTVQH